MIYAKHRFFNLTYSYELRDYNNAKSGIRDYLQHKIRNKRFFLKIRNKRYTRRKRKIEIIVTNWMIIHAKQKHIIIFHGWYHA